MSIRQITQILNLFKTLAIINVALLVESSCCFLVSVFKGGITQKISIFKSTWPFLTK